MVIYVGNFPLDTTEGRLRDVFEQHGNVASVVIVKDKISGRVLGFGLVEMPDSQQALKAIEVLHHSKIGQRTIMVCPTADRVERRA